MAKEIEHQKRNELKEVIEETCCKVTIIEPLADWHRLKT